MEVTDTVPALHSGRMMSGNHQGPETLEFCSTKYLLDLFQTLCYARVLPSHTSFSPGAVSTMSCRAVHIGCVLWIGKTIKVLAG